MRALECGDSYERRAEQSDVWQRSRARRSRSWRIWARWFQSRPASSARSAGSRSAGSDDDATEFERSRANERGVEKVHRDFAREGASPKIRIARDGAGAARQSVHSPRAERARWAARGLRGNGEDE